MVEGPVSPRGSTGTPSTRKRRRPVRRWKLRSPPQPGQKNSPSPTVVHVVCTPRTREIPVRRPSSLFGSTSHTSVTAPQHRGVGVMLATLMSRRQHLGHAKVTEIL